MKFLLTSSGISNDSIHNTLVDLRGKPIAQSSALVISTAWYAYPGGLAGVYQLIRGVLSLPAGLRSIKHLLQVLGLAA